MKKFSWKFYLTKNRKEFKITYKLPTISEFKKFWCSLWKRKLKK